MSAKPENADESGIELPVPTGPIEDHTWLDLPAGSKIEASVKLDRERERAASMQAGVRGIKNKVWHCDGDFVYFRRRLAATPAPGAPDGMNPALVQRHNKMIANGEYRHVATQDDVEIFELTEKSPFKRKGVDLGLANMSQVRWYAIWSVLGKFPGQKFQREADYGMFVDCLEEMAGRIKGMYHEAQAKQVYNEELAYTFHLIAQAGGPGIQAIDRGVAAVRERRGQNKGRVILLPQ